jgi:two-component system sensor histidine kinase TctE
MREQPKTRVSKTSQESKILVTGKKHILSIQSQLIKWLIIPLSIFALILFLYIYYMLNEKVGKFFDNRLYATAQSIENSIGIANGKLTVDLSNFQIDLLSTHEKGSVYYSVIDDKGDILIGHDYLFNKNRIKDANEKVFFDVTYDGSYLRAVSYPTYFYSSGKEYVAYVTIGETTEERDENIIDMINIIFIIMAVVAFFTILITLIAVRNGLTPLHTLKKIIKKRDERDLESLNFKAPKELEDIVKSINILLERSRNTIDYIEQFNSDVSHQLRTPLAEMKMKLELSYEKDDPNFIVLNQLINNMSHITEQLLLYAKTNPATIKMTRFKKINLNKVCKEYSLKTAPRVYAKGFEFAFENLDEEIYILSDKILLESMLDNIINNALHYAVDETGKPIGTITLSLQRQNNTIWLCIKDQGYGVDKKNLKAIFDRYHRVDTTKVGSGLGLSIVKQIAVLHKADIIALNDKGLKISIIFKNEK